MGTGVGHEADARCQCETEADLGRHGTFDDLLHLAAVDAEFSRYRSLTLARFVPIPYDLLQRWRTFRQRWHDIHLRCAASLIIVGLVPGSDEKHEQFE